MNYVTVWLVTTARKFECPECGEQSEVWSPFEEVCRNCLEEYLASIR